MSTGALKNPRSLPDLPDEVLTLIFDHLFDEQRAQAEPGCYRRKYNRPTAYSTLYALARSCRRLYDVAKEVFEQKCVWEFRHPVAAFIQGTDPEPNHDLHRDCRHIEILRDARVYDRPEYQGRSQEELEAGLATREDWPADVQTTLEQDPAQIELALLVARSPNLQTFIMDGLHERFGSSTSYELPVWLYPIIQVARDIPVSSTDNPFYHNLRTLDLHMQYTCTPSMAYLFLLPALRALRLSGMNSRGQFDAEANWPVQNRSSLVDTLILYEVDIPDELARLLITSCRELSRFEYDHNRNSVQTRSTRLVGIMSALEQQQDSLRILRLDPHEDDLMDQDDLTYARIDGFHKLHALQRLSTPFRTLLGRPPLGYTGEGSWQYPQIRDIIPRRLQELSLYMTPTMISREYHDGYQGLFFSALPSQAKDVHLKKVCVDYEHMSTSASSLPFNFWDIKNAYMEHGVAFDYSISAEPESLGFDDYDLPEDMQIDDMVLNLKRYGPKAVEMAHHFDYYGSRMVPKVLSKLGYPEDWMSSEEGQKYMFTS